MNIRLKPGVWIEPAAFFKQIEGAGYQARKNDVRLSLTGTVTKEGDELLLSVADVKPGPQVFRLAAAVSKDAKEQATVTDAFGNVGQSVGRSVLLEGYWLPPANKGGRATLLVRTVGPTPPASKP